MLDYHLQMLQQAGLAEIKEVTEIRQLLPCIADTSKFRIIARIKPPLGGALKLLEPLFLRPLFPRARYS